LFEVIYIEITYGKNLCILTSMTVFVGLDLVPKNVLFSPNLKCNLISIHQHVQYDQCLVSYGLDFYLILNLMSNKLIGAGSFVR